MIDAARLAAECRMLLRVLKESASFWMPGIDNLNAKISQVEKAKTRIAGEGIMANRSSKLT